MLGLPRAPHARSSVFDIQPRVVRPLLDGPVAAGWTRVTWDGRTSDGVLAAPGAYLVRLAAGTRC
jgi:flagellar hook assembly protein FlgD